MHAISLIYHDVIEGSNTEASGFPSPDAALYKLESAQFDLHLRAIANAIRERPVTAGELTAGARRDRSLLLTFDDGGASAWTHIAGRLESMGWRGHFFIPVSCIGTKAFMDREQIRDLHRRGHVIGSHSYSHPLRMAQCSWAELLHEWKVSTEVLSEILNGRIRIASLPGGEYSRQVAQAAALAGIEILFTSEPTTKSKAVDGCLILGRYSVKRSTAPETAAAIATGHHVPRFTQKIFWNARKVIKRMGGTHYLTIRTALIRKSESAAWNRKTKE